LDLTKVRHALVTDGASGIGLVNAFVEHGIAVTAIDIVRERLDEQFAHRGDEILPYQLDARDRAGWVQAIVMRSIDLDLSHIFTHPALWPAVDHRNEVIKRAAQIAAENWPAIP
jgi:NAD(P)-dependent dehydrogenase (short-subunit alcohol dehydrogenase family)